MALTTTTQGRSAGLESEMGSILPFFPAERGENLRIDVPSRVSRT